MVIVIVAFADIGNKAEVNTGHNNKHDLELRNFRILCHWEEDRDND